ncbi:hypothetical protein V6N13_072738 [Hibiscus sabdariffa]
MAKYKARTSYWRKKRIDKNPSPTLSIDGKEKAIADHTRGLTEGDAMKAGVFEAQKINQKTIQGHVENEALWELSRSLIGTTTTDCSSETVRRETKSSSSSSSANSNQKRKSKSQRKENCFNEFNAYLNSQDSASKPVSPVTIGPSWVEVVEKSTGIDQNEKFGELEVAGENPVSDRVREDVLAMGLERHEAQLEDVDLEEGKLFYLG